MSVVQIVSVITQPDLILAMSTKHASVSVCQLADLTITLSGYSEIL